MLLIVFSWLKMYFQLRLKRAWTFNIERDGDLWSIFYQMFEHENNSQLA